MDRKQVEKLKADAEKRARLVQALRKLSKGAPQTDSVIPYKKQSKAKPYKMQNNWERNLRGVPGGGFARMSWAAGTGTRTIEKAPGTFKSRRNANTTQGSYVETVLRDQTGDVISNAQGRDVR